MQTSLPSLPPLQTQLREAMANPEIFYETLPLWIRLCSYGNTLTALGKLLCSPHVHWTVQSSQQSRKTLQLLLLGLPNILTNKLEFFGAYASADHTTYNLPPEVARVHTDQTLTTVRPSRPVLLVKADNQVVRLSALHSLSLHIMSDAKLDVPSDIVLKTTFNDHPFLLQRHPNTVPLYQTPSLELPEWTAHLGYTLDNFYTTSGPLPRIRVHLTYQHATMGSLYYQHAQVNSEPTPPSASIAQQTLLFATLHLANCLTTQLRLLSQLRTALQQTFVITENGTKAQEQPENSLVLQTTSYPPTLTLACSKTPNFIRICYQADHNSSKAAPNMLHALNVLNLELSLQTKRQESTTVLPLTPYEPLSDHQIQLCLASLPPPDSFMLC